MPSIDSLADLNYLRSWMLAPRSLNGGGLATDASIWLDLQIPECPQCYSVSHLNMCIYTEKNGRSKGVLVCFQNWTWHAGDARGESPVLITDWFNAPTDPSGCYLFAATPRLSADLDSPNMVYLRSMRPASSCTDVKLPVVCQMAAHLSSDDQTPHSSLPIVEAEGLCLKNPTPELSNVETFRTNHSVAKSGQKCIR